MTLAAGTRLGPYEIAEPIGKGGMGEVYRARDTKLERDVAIKVARRYASEALCYRELGYPISETCIFVVEQNRSAVVPSPTD